jgi:hypothetical protein
MELLYRGSLHGFKASDFHAKCDNIPKTLTVIKAATSGNIFGGYTEAAWDQSYNWKADKSAFLFSLINKKNKPVKVNIADGKESHAIFCSPDSGPIFGRGYDLRIFDNSNLDNSNYSTFGYSYFLQGYPPASSYANNFLAGSFNFTVDEIEVFRLQ